MSVLSHGLARGGEDRKTVLLKGARDGGMSEPPLNQRPCGDGEPASQRRILKKGERRPGELLGRIGAQIMLAVYHVETFNAERRLDERQPHRHRLKRLDAGPAADA